MVKKLTVVLLISAAVVTGAVYFRGRQSSSPVVIDNKVVAPQEFKKEVYARDLGGVRDLEFSPGGTLLASITSSGKVVVLPQNTVVLENLTRPHGLAFYNNQLYVAEETRLVRYNWDEQNLKATIDKVLFNLPAGGRHFTRSLVFDQNGKLYVSIGSTCDACRENHPWLAAVIVTDAGGNNPAVFASGLRNSVFLAVNPDTSEVWATEMGRDNLGDDFPPDEINILRQGKNYGWPEELNPEPPIYKIQAHSAPLGLTFTPDGDLLVAYHGSWNRTVPVGYKIVRLIVEGNTVVGEEDFLTGGRPVDVVFDKAGNLYYSDDQEGIVYKLSYGN